MRFVLALMITLSLVFTTSCRTLRKKPLTSDTFNQHHIDDWSAVLQGGAQKEEVFMVAKGVLISKGTHHGYLQSKTVYRNTRFVIEWRWAPGTEPVNAGILLRIDGEAQSILPKCVVVQLQPGNTGNIWGYHGATLFGPPDRYLAVEDHPNYGDLLGVKAIRDTEKKPGKWNRMEMLLYDGNLTVVQNGRRLNHASGIDSLTGPVGIQSGGGELQIRYARALVLPD